MAEWWKSSEFVRNLIVGATGGAVLGWLWKRRQDQAQASIDDGIEYVPPNLISTDTEPPVSPGHTTASFVPQQGGPMSFPETGASRDAYILNKVRAGDYQVDWRPVTMSANGHTATFWVNGDALKVDGVRVNVSATLQQQLADIIGARMPTARIFDAMYTQADIRILPMPRQIVMTTAAMIDQNNKIDAALARAVGSAEAAQGKLIGGISKTWLLDKNFEKSAQAVNYGWHFPGSTFQTKAWEASETGAKDPSSGQAQRLIQGRGTVHNSQHQDYSQDAYFVLNKATLDGQTVALDDILTNPELAPLASHQGALTILRQPGVPDSFVSA